MFEKAHPYLKEVLLLCVDTNIKVTLVDDGSRDSKKVEAFAKANNYNYLLISPNKGKGNAIREAAKSIDYEYFIFTDADIPFSVKTMTLLIKTITEKKFNFIIGDRSLEESSYFFKIPVKRNILSKVFYEDKIFIGFFYIIF